MEQPRQTASRILERKGYRQKHYRHEYHDDGGYVYRLRAERSQRRVLLVAHHLLHSGGGAGCRKHRVAFGCRLRAKEYAKVRDKKSGGG